MADVPVLQIIHISDLHFCEEYSDQAKLAREGRMWRLRLRKLIEKRDWFGWHEGTLDHDDTAEAAFLRFLEDMRAQDGVWFPDDDGVLNPPTWLIDTGDGTTFGDEPSMNGVQKRLRLWEATLAGCQLRTLYGNHDAWPGTQPGVLTGVGYGAAAEVQRTQVQSWAPWQPHTWRAPLVAPVPGGGKIECHALDTVRFEWWDNLRAVGRIASAEVPEMGGRIASSSPEATLRILATHHPVAFPYEARDERMWFMQQMVLAHSGKVVRELRNEEHERAALRPLIHLFLSGHTHLGMPGQPLPGHVKEAYQGELGKTQLQLVAGALLLVRDQEKVRAAIGPQPALKDRKDFAQPWVLDANQQFQVLRFYHDSATPAGLKLKRSVMVRVPNADDYRRVPELESTTWMAMSPAA